MSHHLFFHLKQELDVFETFQIHLLHSKLLFTYFLFKVGSVLGARFFR
jgi:hypothetical protein